MKRHIMILCWLMMPTLTMTAQTEQAVRNLSDHIRQTWDKTVRYRPADSAGHIGMPYEYTVPCVSGNFQEMYYWDTYFTNVGLLLSDRTKLAMENTENLGSMVTRFGKVFNGSKYLFQQQSQPPYLCMMVDDVYARTGDKVWLAKMVDVIEKEYQFWMTRRMTPIGLNRYYNDVTDKWGDRGMARYYLSRIGGDDSMIGRSKTEIAQIASYGRSECESGWDFTPRFERRCDDFCPIDLNANLYFYETHLATYCHIVGRDGEVARWKEAAAKRKRLIQKYFYRTEDGFYYDYDYTNGRQSDVRSAAVFSLLFAQVIDAKFARPLALAALSSLECTYGLSTTVPYKDNYVYQWAYPNGWAPLHYIAIKGLDNYGLTFDARRLAQKYVSTLVHIYETTGNLWEKFNVVKGSTDVVSEGNYDMPPMMGWTAGVYLYAAHYVGYDVRMARPKGPEWLSHALFYQIYPSSYKDSDGNGVGDLPGITSKLDYLLSLGINALWINPIFESGWFDGGYDVIDFYKVDPRFGTNNDLVKLVQEAHRRGIKVCLDLVAGHTSNRCAWFLESMKGGQSRYSDYYIWTDSISDEEKQKIALRQRDPVPEASTRGKYVEQNAPRGKYYEKNYFSCQPALNYGFAHPDPQCPWEQSPDAPGPQAVKHELLNIMAFWFDQGVDGFRVDMAPTLIKNDPDKQAVTRLWNEIRLWKDAHYPETVLISEWSNPLEAIPAGFNVDFMMHFGIKGYPSLFFAKNTPFGNRHNFDYCYFDVAGRGQCQEFMVSYSQAYQITHDRGYIAIPSANHDFQRPHIGGRNTIDQLKVAMTFFLTMPGIPFIYYGDEIAMKYQDGLPSKEGSMERAGSRTPMQWTDSPTAGFSTCDIATLYLPVDTENGRLTVSTQEKDPHSMLQFTRYLIKLRKQTPALDNEGKWSPIGDVRQAYPMTYERFDGVDRYIVVLNPSGKEVMKKVAIKNSRLRLICSVGKVLCSVGKDACTFRLSGVSAGIYHVD